MASLTLSRLLSLLDGLDDETYQQVEWLARVLASSEADEDAITQDTSSIRPLEPLKAGMDARPRRLGAEGFMPRVVHHTYGDR